MKFIIKQEILLESLNDAARAISPRNLIPILTGIKFDLKEEGLYLSASDTDISIRCLIPTEKIIEVHELGSIVIGGKYIVEIIKKLPNMDITIEVMDGYKMIVSTANTEFNLNGINPNEFPNLIVRVWGFSAYFNDLPDSYKDFLIERTLKNEGKVAV